MKLKIGAFLVASAFLFSGCANPGRDYVSANKPLAEQGKLAWSTYYEQAYAKYQASSGANKGALLQRLNTMIATAKAYERKEITEEQFHHLRRQMEAEQVADNEASENARHQAALAAAQKMNEANARANAAPLYQIVPPTPLPATTYTNCSSFGNQMNCISR